MELYKLYSEAMFHIANRIVNNTDTAQELMQDAFIITFKKIEDYDETKGVFGAWLKRIVINLSISHLRKDKEISFKPLDEVKELEFEDSQTEEISVHPEDYEKFKNGFGRLKSNYKLILSLHYLEGYDLEEIGDILQISYSNTRTMLTRAKQALKKKIELL